MSWPKQFIGFLDTRLATKCILMGFFFSEVKNRRIKKFIIFKKTNRLKLQAVVYKLWPTLQAIASLVTQTSAVAMKSSSGKQKYEQPNWWRSNEPPQLIMPEFINCTKLATCKSRGVFNVVAFCTLPIALWVRQPDRSCPGNPFFTSFHFATTSLLLRFHFPATSLRNSFTSKHPIYFLLRASLLIDLLQLSLKCFFFYFSIFRLFQFVQYEFLLAFFCNPLPPRAICIEMH